MTSKTIRKKGAVGPPSTECGADRRTKRTLDSLHQAFGELLRAKSYDRITVGEILARANIGRSTFYTHFRSKDALLVSHLRELVRVARPGERRQPAPARERVVRFSLPLLKHIAGHRSETAGLGARGRAILHEHLRQILVESISRDLMTAREDRTGKRSRIPPQLLAQHIAATFVLVLHWWLDGWPASPPSSADELFRTLVLPALDTARE